jgi:integrase
LLQLHDGEGRQVSTITRLLAAVQKAHDLAGLDSPTKEKALAAVLEGIKRHVGTDQKQAPAFSIVQLKQAIAALDLATPRGLRDRALLLLGFSGAFRRSELRGLNLESFSFRDGALIVKMTGSKTSQHQESEEKAFFYSPSPLYCPIRALEAWRECLPRTTGPLFVSMVGGSRHTEGKPSEQRLSSHSINAIVKQHLGEDFSAHSMRASFVTVAVKSGQNWKTIKNQTKHKTNTMIERYTRLDDIVKDNAAQHLGL